MIGMDWDFAAMQLTKARLEQFGSRVRRQVLLKVGNAAAKPLVKAIKEQEIPRVTGKLAKSISKKVKAYAARNIVFVVAGPKSTYTTNEVYMDYRRGVIRRWKAGQPAKGPKGNNPAKYAHLAGPNRTGIFILHAKSRAREEVKAAIREALENEVRLL